jgi:hypothetical protein
MIFPAEQDEDPVTDEPNYILLLNECLKKALPSLGAKEKEKLSEKLEFLRAGLWDAGLRVKKLKGNSGRVVFEARFSRSDRMLFTLGRKAPRRPSISGG